MDTVELNGQVTPFKGNGRRLGYPTANIRTDASLGEGVYFGYADLAEFNNQPAMIFLGVPTTMGDHESRIEVHLLDIPDIDYYNQALSVRIAKFHRPNKKFESQEELIKAMKDDEDNAREWFAKQRTE